MQIGFMQGRLSPIVNGRIQSFPWTNWKNEIELAAKNDFRMMEWTLDQERLYENPLMTAEGQKEILTLKSKLDFTVLSLTGDCFMQFPFYKIFQTDKAQAESLKTDFMNILKSCKTLGIEYIVMPLVDNGRFENRAQEDCLVDFLLSIHSQLKRDGQNVIFECDYGPAEYKRFIDRLPADCFGINYDIGNSAALDIPAPAEFSLYGNRIMNIHIKDRIKGGTTVKLGTGNADFAAVFKELKKISYSGKFILQTARASDEKHLEVLIEYRNFALKYIKEYLA